MTGEQLERAKDLDKEIRELSSFIHTASCCWKGELEVNKKRLFFSNVPFGFFNKKIIECNTTLKDRIKDVIIAYKNELEQELESL